MATSIQVVIDCADPARLAEFWAAALGYTVQPPPDGYDSWEAWLRAHEVPESEWNSASAVVDPDGDGPRIYLQRVPEPKSTKNRMHMDLGVSGGHATPIEERRRLVDEDVQRLVSLGGSIVGPHDSRGEYWVIMQDPEGNEFCVH